MKLLSCLLLLGCKVVSAAPSLSVQMLSADEVCAAVRDVVSVGASAQGLRTSLECLQARAIEAPQGTLSWELADKDNGWRPGAQRLVLRLTSPGSPSRNVAVPVVLTVRSSAWVARRSLRAGETVDPSALDLRDVQWPVASLPAAASELPPTGRAKLPIEAGAIVTSHKLTALNLARQGDAVRLSVRTPGLTLEMPAVLTSDAQIGHVARVQPQGRQEALEGVLVDAATVIVEH